MATGSKRYREGRRLGGTGGFSPFLGLWRTPAVGALVGPNLPKALESRPDFTLCHSLAEIPGGVPGLWVEALCV